MIILTQPVSLNDTYMCHPMWHILNNFIYKGVTNGKQS